MINHPRKTRLSRKDHANIPSFIINTFNIVSSCDPAICQWERGGTSFLVIDKNRLASEVIPNYFKHNQYNSFMRSLNSYRFKKEQISFPDGVTGHRYSHPGFIEGQPDLLVSIHESAKRDSARSEFKGKRALVSEIKALKLDISTLEGTVESLRDELSSLRSQLKSRTSETEHHVCTVRSDKRKAEIEATLFEATSCDNTESSSVKEMDDHLLIDEVFTERPSKRVNTGNQSHMMHESIPANQNDKYNFDLLDIPKPLPLVTQSISIDSIFARVMLNQNDQK
eukprot:CAMPEP_0196805664 /NCGR_PEP_ID=MMETSP1362-20130617/5463_1 /TAXON_ID=163516 /ORGANISM="Leptocylindrus danicus, Strain CCMP1856" /LENGTH=281 /DNA_ID=CAMNT_0042178727 /DNA_START=27 /DNA_END=872 /DNA_ORIENTATION=+